MDATARRTAILAVAGIGTIAALTAVLAAPALEPTYEVEYYTYLTDYGHGYTALVLVYDLPVDHTVQADVKLTHWQDGESAWKTMYLRPDAGHGSLVGKLDIDRYGEPEALLLFEDRHFKGVRVAPWGNPPV